MRRRAALLLPLLLAATGAAAPAPPPLTAAALEAGPVALDASGWRFRAGDDPAWADPALDDAGWYRPAGSQLKGEDLLRSGWKGAGWFRLRVDVGPDLAGRALGFAPDFLGALELYVDGRPAGAFGEPSADPARHRERGPNGEWLLVPFDRPGSHLLAVRYAAPALADPLRGAGRILVQADVPPGFSAQLETLEQARSLQAQRALLGMLATGSTALFLAFGVLYLIFNLYNPRRRMERWFAVFALGMVLGQAGYVMTRARPLTTAMALSGPFLEAAALAMISLGLVGFLARAVQARARVRLAALGLGWTGLLLLRIVPMPPERADLARGLLIAATLAVSAWYLARGLRRGQRGLWLVLAGFVPVVLYPLVILAGSEGDYTPPWVYLAANLVRGLGLLGSLGIYLARDFAAVSQGLEDLNRDLEAKVEARTRDLEDANDRIARLSAGAGQALHDVAGWARNLAQELAPALGARELEVFTIQDDAASAVWARSTLALDLRQLRILAQSEPDYGAPVLTLPVKGLDGELCAALVVHGKQEPWRETDKRLLATFAHQLAGALDLQRLRKEALAAEAKVAAARQDLLDQGIALLQTCPRCRRCFDHTAAACPDDGAALESPRPFPYRVEGRYRLVRVLGQGAMGLVFEAEDERLDRRVAVKTILQEHFDNPDHRLRFEQEALALARISHPGVIAIFDSGRLPDGSGFLVMELLEGRTLRELLEAWGPASPAQVAQLLLQGAAALEAAHRQGLVHRDVKPENVFVAAAPGGLRVKVLDFGLAKGLEGDGGVTRTGMVVGTPRYMSPEQLTGGTVDARTDLYALAAVAFEALTGRRVVGGSTLAEIFTELVRLPAPRPSAFRALPPGVDAAFAAALAKDPDARPASLGAWAAELAALLAPLPGEGWPLETEVPAPRPEAGPDATALLPGPPEA